MDATAAAHTRRVNEASARTQDAAIIQIDRKELESLYDWIAELKEENYQLRQLADTTEDMLEPAQLQLAKSYDDLQEAHTYISQLLTEATSREQQLLDYTMQTNETNTWTP